MRKIIIRIVELMEFCHNESGDISMILVDNNEPGAMLAGPVQIGKTWIRLANDATAEHARLEFFDGHVWRVPDPGTPEASLKLDDLFDELGFSCPCDECW